ncbi:type II toxin-antitoxin system death-on-curing family toxin [Saccharomonospora marina]|uniref:type II toxin-antitoxin system death-on-curing family toxin n=1 Tax=Saccharomonospora marina TaxID=632569 RepID=UPI000A04FAD8|nr:Fic family protein [Saccharomonospora marina]
MAESVRYLNFDYYVVAASEALEVSEAKIRRVVNRGLAESALMAPASGFGDYEKYPSFAEKAAVLLQRIASNHALPDGNKRTALLCTIAFANLNSRSWLPPSGDKNEGEETAEIVEAAAGGCLPLAALTAWVQLRLHPLD